MKIVSRAFAALAMLVAAALFSGTRADPVYQSQIVACTHAATFSSAAGTVQLVAGLGTLSSGAQPQIYVCGWSYVATGASTLQLEYGTGATCGSGTQTITPAFSLAANGVMVDHQPYYEGVTPVPSADNLCVVIGGTGPATGIVYYTQF
jgi:hypothetical protein